MTLSANSGLHDGHNIVAMSSASAFAPAMVVNSFTGFSLMNFSLLCVVVVGQGFDQP